MISRIYRIQQICIISVSGDCICWTFKTCQTVASTSMYDQSISQIFSYNLWWFFVIWNLWVLLSKTFWISSVSAGSLYCGKVNEVTGDDRPISKNTNANGVNRMMPLTKKKLTCMMRAEPISRFSSPHNGLEYLRKSFWIWSWIVSYLFHVNN